MTERAGAFSLILTATKVHNEYISDRINMIFMIYETCFVITVCPEYPAGTVTVVFDR